MRRTCVRIGVGLAASLMAAAFIGCSSISEDTTLQELLDSTGLANATIGDVLGAIEDFTGHDAALPFGQTLTADQESQLAALRDQYLAGEQTLAEYGEQAAAVIGVDGAGRPFGGGHGRAFGREGFPGGPIGPGAGQQGPLDLLELTDEQQTQAQAIFDGMRTDVVALQDAARAEIEALLTDEQRATLDSFDVGYHDAFRAFAHGFASGRLAEALALTAEQQTAIDAILAELRTAVDARREQARQEFRSILTAAQLAQLDAFEASHDFRGPGGF
ncbi:MAG: hypothetical protein CHACPFDD_01119 [Phycisphaerae bacterium]|nr:hypothetical protein [Phycisphaerae bacterium]